jgi:hypothetical protein
MARSLGNTLTWGDQQIPEPVDEVVDVKVIDYDRKRKVVMRRTTKKRRLTLDFTLLITTEKTLLNIENDNTTEIIRAGMDITDATLEKEKMDEKELAATKKELDHLPHLVKYYKDLTQVVIFLRSEFKETYAQFKRERNIFTTCIFDFQEDTLMVLETCKYMQRWYEKAHQALYQIDYISAVKKGRYSEDHDIRVLMDSNISRIRKAAKYWVTMVQEPQQKIPERWGECKKIWEKINQEMENIDLPEFGPP